MLRNGAQGGAARANLLAEDYVANNNGALQVGPVAAQIIASVIAYAVAHGDLELVRDGSITYGFSPTGHWCYFATGENLVFELNHCIKMGRLGNPGWECWDVENEENIVVTDLNLQQALADSTVVRNAPGFKQQQIIKIMGKETVYINNLSECYTGLSTDKDPKPENWINTTAEVAGFEAPAEGFSTWEDFVTSKRAPSWARRAPLSPAAAASPSLAAAASPRHAPQVGPQAAARALLRPPARCCRQQAPGGENGGDAEMLGPQEARRPRLAHTGII